ncbi:MAG: hypothetical protein ACT4SY_00505 [Hyphomicrobiales bacterium]
MSEKRFHFSGERACIPNFCFGDETGDPDGCRNFEVRIRKEGSKKMVDHSMKVAGIDTGKSELHVCPPPDGVRIMVANDAAGIETLVAKCREAGIERAGIEATSIYHRAAASALRRAGIEAANLNRQRHPLPPATKSNNETQAPSPKINHQPLQ